MHENTKLYPKHQRIGLINIEIRVLSILPSSILMMSSYLEAKAQHVRPFMDTRAVMSAEKRNGTTKQCSAVVSVV